ncbi:hypothetical protein QBC44DRAFT_334416 [Cladorrhinum sp. PSN332]|nr:hypothetical protein QBC44DRAFT_334416 [Cladorrhinum sp. PSN332]
MLSFSLYSGRGCAMSGWSRLASTFFFLFLDCCDFIFPVDVLKVCKLCKQCLVVVWFIGQLTFYVCVGLMWLMPE